MTTFVVGDVQGCLEELQELTKLVGYRKGTDTLVLAGDLVDRGPDSLGVIRYAGEQGFATVLGNHDRKYREHRRRDLLVAAGKLKKNEMKPLFGERLKFYQSLTEDDFAFLERMPPLLQLSEKWVVVHAGCEPGIPIKEQMEKALVYVRYISRETGRMTNLHDGELLFPSKAAFWTEMWTGPQSIIYGHHVHKQVAFDEPAPGVWCIGTDTGCCFGHTLSCVILENDQIINTASVHARTAYAKLREFGATDDA